MTIREQVQEFHNAMDAPSPETPCVPDANRIRLRAKLVTEEYFEFMQALYPDENFFDLECELTFLINGSTPKPNVVELVDACADIDYVVEGTRLEFGVNGEPIADIVHASNMAKFGPGSYVREDGKFMKPPDWEAPDIFSELVKQGMK